MYQKKLGVKYLNFLYSFFGLSVLIKTWLGVGALTSVIESTKGEEPEPLFTVANVLTIFAVIFFFTESIFKILACVKNTKAEGYSAFVWALVISFISSNFYIFIDQGFATGLVFFVLSGIMLAINYFYVKKRRTYFGNPDLL